MLGLSRLIFLILQTKNYNFGVAPTRGAPGHGPGPPQNPALFLSIACLGPRL